MTIRYFDRIGACGEEKNMVRVDALIADTLAKRTLRVLARYVLLQVRNLGLLANSLIMIHSLAGGLALTLSHGVLWVRPTSKMKLIY